MMVINVQYAWGSQRAVAAMTIPSGVYLTINLKPKGLPLVVRVNTGSLSYTNGEYTANVIDVVYNGTDMTTYRPQEVMKLLSECGWKLVNDKAA